MAMFHGIQNLEKCSSDKSIIVDIPTPLGDVGKEITLRAILQNNVSAVDTIHYLQHGNDVGMGRGCVVELNLPGLEFPLSSVQRLSIWIRLAEGLYCIPGSGEMVDSRVDNPVCARTQDTLQL